MLMLSNANAKKPEETEKKELLARSLIGQKSLLELPGCQLKITLGIPSVKIISKS